MKRLSFLLIAGFLTLSGCDSSAQSENSGMEVFLSESKSFKDYWYKGKAEISSYDLEQARYGEIHKGDAVLIFVTEDFSKKKQVKLDFSPANGDEKVPIMKLNFTKKFNTGIYPYSMMQSVFTPVNRKKYPHSLKTSMTSQEWCGHTFTQFNLGKGEYKVTGFSYFESEGDENFSIKDEWLEDEVWNMIRIAPDKLPTGKVMMIPGSFYSRLKHKNIKPLEAQISLKNDGEENVYSIQYPSEKRNLTIHFKKDFPHQITGWEESYSDGWGSGAKVLTTKAKLKGSIYSDYWNRNNNSDKHLREELKLD